MSDLNFTADLEDGISSKLKAIEQNMARFKQTAADAGGKLDNIRASSEKVTNAFTVMGAAITAAFVALGLGAADSSKELVGVARELGIATQEVLAFNKAVVAAGGSADRTQDLLRNMSESILEAQVDGADSDKAKAFAALGFTPADLKTASQDLTGFIAEFYKRIEQTQSNAVRTMVTQTLVGAAGELLDPAKLSEQFKPDPAAAKAFETLNTAVNKFSTVISGLQEAVAKGVEPMAAAFNTLSPEQLEQFYKGVELITSGLISMAMAIPSIVDGLAKFSVLSAGFSGLASFLEGLSRSAVAGKVAVNMLALAIFGVYKSIEVALKGVALLGPAFATWATGALISLDVVTLAATDKIKSIINTIKSMGPAIASGLRALADPLGLLAAGIAKFPTLAAGLSKIGSVLAAVVPLAGKFGSALMAFSRALPVIGTIIITLELLWTVFKDTYNAAKKFGDWLVVLGTFVNSLIFGITDLVARLFGIYDILKDLMGLDLGWWEDLINYIGKAKSGYQELIESSDRAQTALASKEATKAAEDRANAIADQYKKEADAADKAAKASKAQSEEAARVAAETSNAIATAIAAVAAGFAQFRQEHTRFVEDLKKNQQRALDDIAQLSADGEWIPVDQYQRTLNQLNRANEDFFIQRKRQLQDQIRQAEASKVGSTDKAAVAAANETIRLANIELKSLETKQTVLDGIALANAKEIAALQQIIDLRDQEIQRMAAIRDTTAEFLKNTQAATQTSIFEGSLRGMTELEAGLARINQEQALAIQAAKESIGFSDQGPNTPEQVAALQEMVAAQNKLSAARRADLTTAQSWSAGWDSAFVSYFDNLSNASKIAAEQMNVIGSAMESALNGFLETGKVNFKSFAADIIRGLLKISIQAEIAERALAMKNAFKGGSSIFGALLSGVMGAAGGMAAGGGSMGVQGDYFGGVSDWASNSFAGKAVGGLVKAGVPYMTGESGRELFMPSVDGTIITNAKLNAMMAQQPAVVSGGGTQVVNHISISALDTRSVAQFFAENKKLLSGAVDSARRDQGRK